MRLIKRHFCKRTTATATVVLVLFSALGQSHALCNVAECTEVEYSEDHTGAHSHHHASCDSAHSDTVPRERPAPSHPHHSDTPCEHGCWCFVQADPSQTVEPGVSALRLQLSVHQVNFNFATTIDTTPLLPVALPTPDTLQRMSSLGTCALLCRFLA